MLKKIAIFITFLVHIFAYSQIPVTKVFSNYGGFWSSSDANINTIRPDNSHNLLGFSWNGGTYSTGVNDALLTTNSVSYTPIVFKALAGNFGSANVSSNTFIGVGKNFGGAGNISPVPVESDLSKYLTDGTNGLDLGTAIFNFPASGNLQSEIVSINPASIGDGIPDIVLTQLGDISNSLDQFYFVDANNVMVGTVYNVNFGTVPNVGNADWKFYNANVSPPAYNSSVSNNGTRQVRMLAFDWSELGLTMNNITSVKKFVQIFSGQSDTAFTAYNTASISLKTSVSGIIYNDNDGGGVADGNGYQGATVLLKTTNNVLVSTATTNATGKFLFPNISGGNYIIELQVPAGFTVVSNRSGTLSNSLAISVSDNPVTSQNFGINQAPTAVNDVFSTEFNTALSANISTNDNDPNNGIVVSSTINLITPTGSTNVITSGGLVKGFTIVGQGSWIVNTAGVLNFTPVAGFSGNATIIKYTIRDNANLISNEATISIRVESFCYKPGATTGTTLETNHGITSLGRAGAEVENWPMVRKGAWTALESKTKGFVINRIATTAILNAIPNPVEGMLVYDEQAACLKIYTTTDNAQSFSWKCLNTQTCPN